MPYDDTFSNLTELLGESLGGLKVIGDEINTEIRYQNELLEELDRDADETAANMSIARRKLNEVVKSKSSKCLICIIIALMIAIIILLFQ